MSIPALRQPKLTKEPEKKNFDEQFVILTLKNKKKLVIKSDAFHGIIMLGHFYKCVLCDFEMETRILKECHKDLNEHRKNLSIMSFIEDLSENLIRPINKLHSYCTVCNVVTSSSYLMRHIDTDEHTNELNRAVIRASLYKPLDENNNK